jgi:hypothetical protein
LGIGSIAFEERALGGDAPDRLEHPAGALFKIIRQAYRAGFDSRESKILPHTHLPRDG